MSSTIELTTAEKKRLYNAEYQRKRRAEQPERIKELAAAWRDKNPDYFTLKAATGYFKEKRAVYRKAHPEEVREAARRYRNFNAEAARLRDIDI